MSEELPSDGAYKTRSALGDVTNQVGKRGFCYISTSGVKSGDGYKKDEGFQFAKKGCLGVENFRKENFHKEIAECVLRPHSCSEINSLKGNIIASISKIPCEIKEPCSPDTRGNATSSTAVKSGDAVRNSCVSTQSIPIIEAEEDERVDSGVVLENASKEKVENSSGMHDGNDVSLDNLDSSKDEYLDCSRLPESQESRCGLERCIGQKGDGGSRLPESQESRCGLERCIGQKGDGGSSMCIDLIKVCQCSFCMKAAYLWSDLHYQDMKGRIAAIKKSQNEASVLVHRHSRESGMGRYGQGNLEKFSNLESDLTGRWRSLFLHMEDIFVREGSQLEASLLTLKGFRDNCKTDLDSEKH